jgi:diguanylate cyclase (GGDEF)-like protein/PAS domain S-box-containing protein
VPRPLPARGRHRHPPVPKLSSTETLRELFLNLREGVYITSEEGEILDANPAMLRMFGVESFDELGRRRVQEWIEPSQREQEHAILERDGVVRDFEFTFRRSDGEVRTVIDTAFVRRDPSSGKSLYYGILIDITERKQLERQLVEQGLRDPLTGCFNRRYLTQFEAARRGRGWACIAIDVDDFKAYNDRFGHQVGDQVLVRMGRFLGSLCRAEDAVVRMGGDEFVILLAETRAHAIAALVRRLERAARRGGPVPFSLGWARRLRGEELERTIARADRKLIAVRVNVRSHSRRAPPGAPRLRVRPAARAIRTRREPPAG